MKKNKIFLISFLTCLCLFVFLGACDKKEHEHNYKSYIYKEANCSQVGLIEKLCLDCGDKKYEEIPTNNEHDYEWTTTKEATCKEEGSKKGVCKYCNDEKTETILKGEHNYVWQILRQVTCTSEGISQGICIFCNGVKQKTLSKIEHQYKNGRCLMCNSLNIVATLSQGEEFGITYQDVVNKINTFGYKVTPTNFLNLIKGNAIKIASKNGQIKLEYTLEEESYSFALDDMISDFVINAEDENIIEGLMIKSDGYYPNSFYVIYQGGQTGFVGDIDTIKSIAINEQNQFLVINQGDEVALFGIVKEGISEVLSNVLYIQTGETFACLGFVEHYKEQKDLSIAPSHMGKVVDSIGENAFCGNNYLEKVVLSLPFGYFLGCGRSFLSKKQCRAGPALQEKEG